MHDDLIAEKLGDAEEWKFRGRHDAALEILEELLLDDPSNVTALEEVAENELCLANYARAGKAARRVLRLAPESYVAHYVLGFLATRSGDFARAVRMLTRANLLDPNNPEILRCLGHALYGRGDAASGLVTLERALNLDPRNVQTLCTLASIRLDAGARRAARHLYLQALQIDPQCLSARDALKEIQGSGSKGEH